MCVVFALVVGGSSSSKRKRLSKKISEVSVDSQGFPQLLSDTPRTAPSAMAKSVKPLGRLGAIGINSFRV
jgi:hypothetical protein